MISRNAVPLTSRPEIIQETSKRGQESRNVSFKSGLICGGTAVTAVPTVARRLHGLRDVAALGVIYRFSVVLQWRMRDC